jgi:hypothetical protein
MSDLSGFGQFWAHLLKNEENFVPNLRIIFEEIEI